MRHVVGVEVLMSIYPIVKRLLVLGLLLSMLTYVEHANAISPRQLVEVADFNIPVVSPDGSTVAFRVEQASIERNTYDTAWYVQDVRGNTPPRRVADGGVPLRDTAGISEFAAAVWSPDGRWIYYRAFVGDRIDVWRAAADGSGAEPLTLDPADVRDFSLSDDGRTLMYSIGATRAEVISAEQDEYDRGIRIDETAPIGQSLFRSGNIKGRLATQRLGPIWFERVSLLADVPDRWKAVDLATRSKWDVASSGIPAVPLTASDLAQDMSEPWRVAQDPQSGRVALLTRVGELDGLRDRPDVELSMLPGTTSRQPVKCQAELCTEKAITDIQWRPNSDEVLFTVTDPDQGLAQSIFRWNVQTGLVYPVVYSQGSINGGGRWAPGLCGPSSSVLVCVAAEADRPPRLEKIDLETGDRQILFDPNASLARDVEQAVQARLLRWTDAEGRQFTGQFFPARRTGETLPALFVNYYRCTGFLRGGVGDEWPLMTLAEAGVSTLCINSAPYRLDAVERFDLGKSAVESAVKLLASAGEIDGTKIGMGGLSFGSEVTMWTAMNSEMLTAASVSSPLVSPTYYLLGSIKGDVFFSGLRRFWQVGPYEETDERWQEISPSANLDKIRSPILMQVPEQEYIHLLDYAIPLIRRKRADLYVFPHEPHQKFQPRHKLAVYERNLDWFRFWLQGVEDDDPRKAEQYKHWRLMREAASSRSRAIRMDKF